MITLRNYYRRKPQALRDAELRNLPIYVLKSNTLAQMEQALLAPRQQRPPRRPGDRRDPGDGGRDHRGHVERPAVDLAPQNAYIRRLQHQMAQRYNLAPAVAAASPIAGFESPAMAREAPSRLRIRLRLPRA